MITNNARTSYQQDLGLNASNHSGTVGTVGIATDALLSGINNGCAYVVHC